jgi:hypothetical protein
MVSDPGMGAFVVTHSVEIAEPDIDAVGWSAVFPFAVTIFLGAFLLFQVQPLIGKYVLPWFGGAPSVWTACLLFFQTVLLAGYAYAHFSTRMLSPRMQAIVHILLLVAAVCVLPITPSVRWKPKAGDDPTLRILLLLTACVGLPYFALSATGPLLQAWLARRWPHRPPYRFYALSNIGSFLALLSYPVLIEPMLTRHMQSVVWSVSLVIFVIVCGYCAIISSRFSSTTLIARSAREKSLPNYVLWLLLPATASLLLLAVTNTICQDIAVIPLLWIVPLAIYLSSFVICFDSPRWYDRRVFVPLMFVGLALVCWAAFPGNDNWPVYRQVAAYVIALFTCCMVLHGELYRLKPSADRLTSYYLSIAAGGSLGGVFVAIVAPLVFTGYTELQIGLMLSYVLLLVALFRDPGSPLYHGRRMLAWLGANITAAMLALLLWASATTHLTGSRTLARARNFYGVLTVYQTGNGSTECRLLHHGGITHGLQMLDPKNRDEPTAYYGRNSGVGLALQSLANEHPRRIGIIGLGAGTLATYATPGDLVRFYEINPMVIEFAKWWFTFLADSPGRIDIVTGDARLSLEAGPAQNFDLLVVDAFSGDAIPVHLLTAECIDLYLHHLSAGGIIAIHISNQHLDLEPVVRQLASHADLVAVKIESPHTEDKVEHDADWMLLARDRAVLDVELIRHAASPPPVNGRAVPLWTDDYSDLIRILR